MYWRYWSTDLWLNIGWGLAHWRRRFALFWYGADKTPWMFVAFVGLVLATLGFALYSVIEYQEDRAAQPRANSISAASPASRATCISRRAASPFQASMPSPRSP